MFSIQKIPGVNVATFKNLIYHTYVPLLLNLCKFYSNVSLNDLILMSYCQLHCADTAGTVGVSKMDGSPAYFLIISHTCLTT